MDTDKLGGIILMWADRMPNPIGAAGVALKALERAESEHKAGASVARALYDNFNDRLLTRLERAAGVPVTYGGGGQDRGRPA